MSIIEYTGPSNPQEIRKYLMRRTKEEIVWEYLRQWREYGELEKERDALAAHVEAAQRLADEDRVDEALFTAHYEKPDPGTLGWKSKLGRDLHRVLKGAPTTSLVTLKAEWQAEAVEEVLSELRRVRRDEPTVKAMDAAIDAVLALRPQAEGGE